MSSATSDDMTLEWEFTVRCRTTLTLEEARRAFGLGGTPDAEMRDTVCLLGRHAPHHSLLRLASHPETARESGHSPKLLKIDGQDAADF